MDNFKHLSEVLKSQITLYSELADLITAEKEAIVAWAVDKTVEITKQKEFLLKKEHIQEEARKALLEKIARDNAWEKVKLMDVIQLARKNNSELADELHELGERLVEIITVIHAENLSLRMLYATNSRLINDFFITAGLAEGSAYGPKAGITNNKRASSLHNIVG